LHIIYFLFSYHFPVFLCTDKTLKPKLINISSHIYKNNLIIASKLKVHLHRLQLLHHRLICFFHYQ